MILDREPTFNVKNSSLINYQIINSFLLILGSKTYSDWFDIDRESGVVTTQSYLDCELEGSPKVIVVATDKVFLRALFIDMRIGHILFKRSLALGSLSRQFGLGILPENVVTINLLVIL